MKDDRYFRTSSFYPAVFLFAKGAELVSVDKVTNPRRAVFVFADFPEREALLDAFNYGKPDSLECMVDTRKFVSAIRLLKEKLHEEAF